MVLPAMSRDMNLMRQNIAKLVKISGGKPTYKTDLFFKAAKEREATYENLFKRENRKLTPVSTTTPEKQKTEASPLGFLGMFTKTLKDLKDGIINSFKNIGSTILTGILAAFSIDNIIKAFGLDGKIMTSLISFLTKIVTNPFFIGLAAITSVAALMNYLKGNEDEKQKKYLELSKRKSEGEILSTEEEAQLKEYDSLKNRQAAIEQYGYDPILGKKSDTTRTEGIRRQTEVDRIYLEDTATGQLLREGNTNPSIKDIKERAEVIKNQRTAPAPETTEKSKVEIKPTASERVPDMRAGRGFVEPSVAPPLQNTTPMQISKNPLLELIAKGEAVKEKGSKEFSYDSMNQGTAKGSIVGSGISTDVIGQKLTDMTVGDILSRAPTKNMSAEERQNKKTIFAAGKYQIIPNTLNMLMKKGDVSANEKFTPELQDRLALALIERRNINKLIQQGNLEEAQYKLSQEWASIPAPKGRLLKSGQISTGNESFYGGVNKANIKSSEVMAVLQRNDSKVGSILSERSAENKMASFMPSVPIVVNAPTTNNVRSPSSAAPSVTVPASVIDVDMATLLSRVI
jgi:muramidase (phage lysozyme)